MGAEVKKKLPQVYLQRETHRAKCNYCDSEMEKSVRIKTRRKNYNYLGLFINDRLFHRIEDSLATCTQRNERTNLRYLADHPVKHNKEGCVGYGIIYFPEN